MSAQSPGRLILAVLLGALAPHRALAFTATAHTAISQQALKEQSFDQAAADAVTAGNLKTDEDEGTGGEFWTAAAHFDNEQLAAGSARLKTRLNAAAEALDD